MQTQHKPLPKQLKLVEEKYFKAEELNPYLKWNLPHILLIHKTPEQILLKELKGRHLQQKNNTFANIIKCLKLEIRRG